MKKDFPRQALSTDKYVTDEWIRAMFPSTHWYDPCPIDWDPKTHKDGLMSDWLWYIRDVDNQYIGAFVNPPYSNPLPWVKKAILQSQNFPVVMLLKHDTSTEWYRTLHEAGAKFLLVNGRLKYGTNKGAAFPSLLAVLP